MAKNITEETRLYEIMIQQQTRFGFTKELIQTVLQDWKCVELFAYIVHDKDYNKDGTPKEPHIHLILRFRKGSEPTVKSVMERFNLFAGGDPVINGVERFEYLGKKAKCPNTLKWASACAYLTHEVGGEGKHIYERFEVKANFDFNVDIDAFLEYQSNRDHQSHIIQLIGDGTINRFNYTNFITVEEWTKQKRVYEAAFQYREDLLSSELDRSLRCLYLYAPEAGVGKTDFAKRYARSIGYSVATSSSQNDPWQDYRGEDAFILDDWRPAGWSVADMLKMCDPYTCSSVKSRYRNKDTHNLKLLIFTSTLPFDEIWNFMEDSQAGPKAQLSRRISLRGIVTAEKITITDHEINMSVTFDNPAAEYKKQQAHPSRLFEIQSAFGGSISPAGETVPAPSVTSREPEEPGPWDYYTPNNIPDIGKEPDSYD